MTRDADRNREKCRDYYEENSDYMRAQGRAAYQRYAEKTGRGKNSGRPYTPADDAIICSDKYTLIEAALLLGRSYGSVNARRLRLRRDNYELGNGYTLKGE